jgi:hypothetical protein
MRRGEAQMRPSGELDRVVMVARNGEGDREPGGKDCSGAVGFEVEVVLISANRAKLRISSAENGGHDEER